METIKTKIENEKQYDWAIARIDELLKVVHDDTPDDDPNSIELYLLSSLVEEYEDVHYPIQRSWILTRQLSSVFEKLDNQVKKYVLLLSH